MMKKSSFLKSALLVTVLIGIGSADIIHTTTKWQSIGYETIKHDGSSNNGVFWSLDDGASWSLLSSGAEFTKGETVGFKVEIWKEFQGTHLSDVAKVWIDEDEIAKGEWALKSNGNKKKYSGKYYSYYDGNVTNGNQTTGNPEFLDKILFDYTFSEARDYELIARTMCSDDLAGLNTNDGNKTTKITYITDANKKTTKSQKLPSAQDWVAFTSTNPSSTYQGEIEKYTITVRDVPEPATLTLFGVGLLSFALLRKKRSL